VKHPVSGRKFPGSATPCGHAVAVSSFIRTVTVGFGVSPNQSLQTQRVADCVDFNQFTAGVELRHALKT